MDSYSSINICFIWSLWMRTRLKKIKSYCRHCCRTQTLIYRVEFNRVELQWNLDGFVVGAIESRGAGLGNHGIQGTNQTRRTNIAETRETSSSLGNHKAGTTGLRCSGAWMGGRERGRVRG